MPRNPSGTYTLPEDPFIPNTVILSAPVNNNFSDIGDSLTDSLSRSGEGGMLSVLQMDPSGAVYSNDTDTGLYRTGANAQALKCGGVDIVEVSSSGANIVGTLSQNGSPLFPIGFGPFPCVLTTPPPLWIFVGKLYSRVTYADLWAVAQEEIALGNTFFSNGDGSTTFGVGLNMPGRVPACNDSISGSAAGTLTQAIYGTNPAVIGNAGGDEENTLIQGNLPNVNLTTTIAAGQGSHTHVVSNIIIPGSATDGTGATVPLAAGNRTTDASTLPAMTGTTPLGGSGTPLTNVQPSIITNYIIFAGV